MVSDLRTYIGDCARIPLPDDSVDLVITSPPYEKGARIYEGLDFDFRGEEWVEWALPCYEECLRVSRGLVAWVGTLADKERPEADAIVKEFGS